MSTNLGSIYGRIVIDASGVSAGVNAALGHLEKLQAGAQRIGAAMRQVGDQLTQNVTAPLVAVGVASGKMAMDFQESMQHIVGLVGVSQQQVNAWSQELQAMGPQVGKGPKELADALYFVTSSGLQGAEAIDAVNQSARAASAGLGSTQIVADAVTSAMNAYRTSNLTAAQATDVLVATVREGKGEADQIAPALGRVIPIAAQLGVSFNEVGAALAGMTLVGFDAAEASTNLSGILSAFIKPSKQASEVLAQFGLSGESVRRTLDEDGLLATLTMLNQTIGQDDEALAKIYPNIRGFRGALALVGENAQQVQGIFGRLADATGDADKAFEAVTQTAKFQFNAALAEVQTGLIKIGEAVLPVVIPMLKDLARTLQNVTAWFASLPAATQQTIVQILALVAALGPMLAIGGRLIGTVGSLVGVIKTFGTALVAAAKFAGSFAKTTFEVAQYLAEAGTAGLAVAGAFAAVAAAAVVVIKFFDAASKAAQATNDELIKLANADTGNLIEDAFTRAGAAFELIVNGSQRMRDVFVAHQDEMRNKLLAGEVTLEDYNTEIERSAKVAGLWGEQITGTTGKVLRIDGAVKVLTQSDVRQAEAARDAAIADEALAASLTVVTEGAGHAAGTLDGATQAALDYAEAQAAAARESEAAEAQLNQLRALIDGEVGATYDDWKQQNDELILKQQALREELKKVPGALRREEIETELGGIAQALEENAQAYDARLKRILFDMAVEQLAADGLTAKEMKAINAVALKFGLIDQATADMASGVLGATQQLAQDGNIDAFVGNIENGLTRAKLAGQDFADGMTPLATTARDKAHAVDTEFGGMAAGIKTNAGEAEQATRVVTTAMTTMATDAGRRGFQLKADVDTAIGGINSTFLQYGPTLGNPLKTGIQQVSDEVLTALNAIIAKVSDVIASLTGIRVPPLQLPTGGSDAAGNSGGSAGGGSGNGGGNGSGGGSPSCFLAGTLIELWDGTLKPIEQVMIGDVVRSFDRRADVSGQVTGVTAHTANTYYVLTLADDTTLQVTGEHPIYAPRLTRSVERVHGDFVRVKDLQTGDTVETVSGPVQVTGKQPVERSVTVYNFNVDLLHTYIANGVRVHNVKLAGGGRVFPGLKALWQESGATRPEILVSSRPGFVLNRQDAMLALRNTTSGAQPAAAGNTYVTVPGVQVSNPVDIELLAYRVAERIEQRRRWRH